MKAFLINLDREANRLAAASAQLRGAGVDFERFPAVYGKDLPAERREKEYRHFRWWCAVGRPIRDGEIGCALSHYGVYRKMLSEDIPLACVFEDDVLIEGDLSSSLAEVEAFCDLGKPQVFLLSNHTGKCEPAHGILRSRGDRHAESYVLTKAAVASLLKANCPMAVPCDYWDRWAGSGVIELYHVFPTICRPNEAAYASGTAPSGSFNVRDLPMLPFLLHKVKRLAGVCIDRFLLSMGVQ